jgi:predicted nucleic acid-binding protein
LSIWTGFEGYRDPAEDEVLDLLRSCTVVVDTNVFLDLYSFEQPARDLALDVLESLEDRLFVPHQVMREFWRNRHGVIATVAKPSQPLATVRDDLLGTVNSLRPDRQRPQDIEQLRTKIDQLLNELETAVDTARGEALEIHKILHDTSLDPVVNRLESILNGHIGPALGADESQLIEDGLKRFEKKVPPGYEDGSGKAGQIPERGTGDFLLWEQTLRQISTTGATAFVLVTGDSKEDWRTVITKPSKRALGVRPELVAEALDRTGAQFVLLSPTDFYRLMGRIRPSDGAASLSLVSATELLIESREQPGRGWTASAYRQLLSDLRADGNDAQADVIEFASLTGGFIRREAVIRVVISDSIEGDIPSRLVRT